MNRRGRFAVLALALCLALPAWSKGWEPVGYTLRMNAFNTSNAFPGSSVAAADHGVEPRGELVSGVRLSKAYKLGVSLSAGGNVERAYTRGNFAWLGAGALLRHRTTTYTLDGEWTPKRDKFPTNVDEGGEYSGKKLTLGVRQALGSRARLRVEGTLDHDRFVPALSERDTRGRELFTSLSVTCAPGIDLRVEGSLARDIANGPKYDTNTHWFGVGLVRADSLWRTDLGVRSAGVAKSFWRCSNRATTWVK